MNKKILSYATAFISFNSAAAIEFNDHISLSGFGSTSWATSDNDIPVLINRNIDSENCFDCDTTFGLQLDFYYDAFKASAQLVKRPQDEWSSPELEWAYIGYEWNDFEFRAGRLRLPLFLASEYYYVGHAYTYARPPTEIYNSVLGITAFNGISLNWNYEINDELLLSLTPFIGFKDENTVQFDSTFKLEFETNGLYGFNSQLSGDNYRINLAILQSNYDVTAISSLSPFPPVPDEDIDVTFYSLGGEYYWDQLKFTLEAQKNEDRASWYSAVDYNLDKFTPYFIYGQTYIDNDKSGNSYSLGVRYDLLYNVSLNAEWQRLNSYNGYTGPFVAALPPGVPFNEVSADLYTIMVNFVF